MPQLILVAICSPDSRADRTALYSPFTKDFDLSNGQDFEPRIEGKGKEYVNWVVDELKPMIDRIYRTKSEKKFTGICGYSTGALNSIYAILADPRKTFSRLIAISPAVYIWMDCLEKILDKADYSHITSVYLDAGTDEYGRMTTKEQFIEGAKIIYKAFLKGGVPEEKIKFGLYQHGKHTQSD